MPSYVTKEITAVSSNSPAAPRPSAHATAATSGAMPAKNSSRLNHGIITRSSSRQEVDLHRIVVERAVVARACGCGTASAATAAGASAGGE